MNTIDAAYEAGLKVLNPAARDLEHGLELHRESLVVDTYGFGPQATARADRLRALAEAGAATVEMQDARENDTMTRWAFDPDQRRHAQRAWRASGVNCIFVNAGEESNRIDTLIKRLARRSYAATIAPDVCRRAFHPEDIQHAGEENAHCYYLSINGVPLPDPVESAADALRSIRVFFQLGVRMMHLTYNRANVIGDGCGERRDAGLTDFGRAAVAEMNRVGVVVDVAHCGGQTSLEAAKRSERPVVASHSMCRALADHARGKTDNVLRAIADSGGYIGILAPAVFLRRSYDVNALLDHIEHAVRLVGPDHVGIGTDVGMTPDESSDASSELPMPKRRRRWEALSPADSANTLPKNWSRTKELSLRWTNFPLFTVGMVQRGFSDEAIRKILGGNALRVAKTLWDGRDP